MSNSIGKQLNLVVACTGVSLCLLGQLAGGWTQGGMKHQGSSLAGHSVLRVLNRENGWLGGIGGCWPEVILEEKKDRFWIGCGTDRIVGLYDERYHQWTEFRNDDPNSPSLPSGRVGIIPIEVRNVGQSKDGTLWFCGRWTRPKSPQGSIFASSFDGEKWAKWEIKVNPQETVSIGLFKGRNGRLWFWNGDDLMANDGQGWFGVLRLSTDPRFKVLLDKNGRGGRQDGMTRRMSYEIYSGMQDSDGCVWLGTAGGLVSFEESSDQIRTYRDVFVFPVKVMSEDRRGRIWFGDWDAVSVYDKVRRTIKTYRLANQIPASDKADSVVLLRSIYHDKNGQTLFALNCGLLSYIETDNRWELLRLEGIGLANSVSYITEDRLNRIWVATQSGIAVLDQ